MPFWTHGTEQYENESERDFSTFNQSTSPTLFQTKLKHQKYFQRNTDYLRKAMLFYFLCKTQDLYINKETKRMELIQQRENYQCRWWKPCYREVLFISQELGISSHTPLCAPRCPQLEAALVWSNKHTYTNTDTCRHKRGLWAFRSCIDGRRQLLLVHANVGENCPRCTKRLRVGGSKQKKQKLKSCKT